MLTPKPTTVPARFLRHLLAALAGGIAAFAPLAAFAQTFDGGGILQGMGIATGIVGILPAADPAAVGWGVLARISQYLVLLGTITITVAGLYLILGLGEDSSKDKAKKIVLYTAVGIAVVLFANVIVNFVYYLLNQGGTDPSPIVAEALFRIMGFTALLATIAIVIAGFYLILGLGEDSSKDKAKKIVIYAAVGIALIGLAGTIVSFIYAMLGLGGTSDTIRTTVTNVLSTALSFLALIATITVIVAGIYLIVGMGSDESREKAKKIIIYTLVGLLIVFLARVIVGLVTSFVAGAA